MVAVAVAVVVVAVVAEMEAKQLDLGSNPASDSKAPSRVKLKPALGLCLMAF